MKIIPADQRESTSELPQSEAEAWEDEDTLNESRQGEDDGTPTETSQMQLEVEATIVPLYFPYKYRKPPVPPSSIKLNRAAHIEYLQNGLSGLSGRFVALDASQPWLVYWMLHGLDLLEVPLSADVAHKAVQTIARCQNKTGGFGGGPGQVSHAATTYAAVNALAIIGTQEAYNVIDRAALLTWFKSLKRESGFFVMNEGGEMDVRGTYCVLATAKLLDIMTPELTENCGQAIAKSQTYEGGISGYMGSEAHGGYTFCAFAALLLLRQTHLLDLDNLARWLCFRQMSVEGGFSGRTNKLVDGCYSFWQGGSFPLLECVLRERDGDVAVDLFNRESLQEYILVCCQAERGGMLDKPEKSPDFYHTCYVLSGLSIAQHKYTWDAKIDDLLPVKDNQSLVFGHESNALPPTHPIHNIRPAHVSRIQSHFAAVPTE
ncbi:terpenoid cyclases/protein prenyltransferase alpha-alpha toroid [Phlyctochytrium arcticum]|nr:terpenoid cyclases/protein prenyltransferase alpha-alpha toroid [Phlyctochytrium arcticum]